MTTIIDVAKAVHEMYDNDPAKYEALVNELTDGDNKYYLDDPDYFVSDAVWNDESAVKLVGALEKAGVEGISSQAYIQKVREAQVKAKEAEDAVRDALNKAAEIAEQYGVTISADRFTFYPEGHPSAPEYCDGMWASSSDMC